MFWADPMLEIALHRGGGGGVKQKQKQNTKNFNYTPELEII